MSNSGNRLHDIFKISACVKKEVDMIITDLCVMDVDHENGLTLIELAPNVTVDDVVAATEASFKVSPNLKTMELF